MVDVSRAPRILALTGHPVEAAGARHRILQFLPGLRERGFQIEHSSFFTSSDWEQLYAPNAGAHRALALLRGTGRRARQLLRARNFDLLWVHLWLHPITFPPFDAALRALNIPLVYDFDDAFYAPNGGFADRLRDRHWTTRMMRRAHTVVAGSDYIRDYVQQYSERVEVLPTAVDTDRFTPRDFDAERNPRPVIGWVGSHSTARYLDQLYPVLERLAQKHDFLLRIIGAGKEVSLSGVRAEWLPWRLENEVDNFRQLDIGLYPLQEDEFASGKHGFKMHQYMAVAVPTVASAVGVNPKIIQHGETAFLASNPDDWYTALDALLTNEPMRRRVGYASRNDVVAHASLRACLDRIDGILRSAAASRKV